MLTVGEMIILVIPRRKSYTAHFAASRWIFLQLHRRLMTSGSRMIPPRGHGLAPRVAEAAESSLGLRLFFFFFVVLHVESPYPAEAVFSEHF